MYVLLLFARIIYTRMMGALTPRQQLGNAPVHWRSSWFFMSASTFSNESNRQRYSTIVEIAMSGSVKLGHTGVPIQARAMYILHMGEVSSDNCSEAQIWTFGDAAAAWSDGERMASSIT